MIQTRLKVLVDSSIWIDHFSQANPQLQQLLREGNVVIHPMVWGEVSCGSLPRRAEILQLLAELPPVEPLSDDEVRHAIESRHWWSKGIGWVDAHLLASSILSGFYLWTNDKRLMKLSSDQHSLPN